MISTAIKLDGEAEFKKQLGDVNSNLKTLKSEMQLTTEQFKGQANSMEALTAKDQILRREIEQQEEKVRALTQALEDASEVYADSPGKIDKYQQSLNRAKTDLINMQRELADTDRYLDEARTSADKTAKSIDEFGKEAKDAGGKQGVQGLVDSLDDLKGIVTGGAVVAGIKAVSDSIVQLVDDTEEYRKIMGTLETSSQAAGYTADQTSEAYTRLYGVLGDTQATATTVANLQAIGFSQEDLLTMIDITSGAWAKYGDSIPIDGLAEAINLAVQQSEVSGVLADVIEWAGGNTDMFAKRLESANTQEERANVLLHDLANQGLADAGQAWRDNNDAIVKVNEAQADYEAAQATLAEKMIPAKMAILELKTGAWDILSGAIQTAMDLWNDAVELFSKEKELRKDGFFVSQEERMAAYGYEKYYTEDGLLRYRQVESNLAGANVHEAPLTAADISSAAASAWYAAKGNEAPVQVTVNAKLDLDGRTVAEVTQPYLQSVNKSNPEVVSDP